MSALPMHPTERDRERFRDLTKAMQFGLEYDRHGDNYKYDLTDLMFRLWWSVERERQLLQNLNQSQGCRLSELAQELERLSALLQSTPQAPTVPDDRVSQDESTLTMAASALVLFRAGESAEYMAKAIEALLQSAPQSGSEPVAHHPV